ncbi:hypothetical protein Ahy_A03g016005 [Arachis hypogaea]|uniref:Uncharacterized protein n=1 Tax=Arachis hypogaea TaxID=3818 RepID=A0A445E1Z2_ARAHY|nr:hypothetical protein Ahy_A03g016005 [Arachis hypogaea]
MWNKDNWDASNSWSGGSLTCQSLPEERPAMKDVTAMLKEIRHENDEFEKPDFLHKGMAHQALWAIGAAACNPSTVRSQSAVPSSLGARTLEPSPKYHDPTFNLEWASQHGATTSPTKHSQSHVPSP